MRMTRKVLVAAATLMVPAALAHADVKLASGAACVQSDGSWLNIEYGSGRARLTADDWVTLICPVVREYPTNASIDGRASVTDASSGDGSVTCTLRCCSNSGTNCDTDTATATDGGGDQYCDPGAVDAQSYGPCTFYCLMKGTNDRLRLYEYTE